MKFNEIEIFVNKENEIVLKQGQNEIDKYFGVVVITKDQAELVAEELKKLAKN